MKLRIPKSLIKFAGDLYIHKYPLFILYRPAIHKVKGWEVRQVLDFVYPGDTLLRRYDGYLNTIFTPGFYSHAGLCVEDNKIIHAMGQGVVKEDVLTFCRTDSLCVLRPYMDDLAINLVINQAEEFLLRNMAYDFEFEPGDDELYCTELINDCYGGIFKDDFEKVAGNLVLTPDGIRYSQNVKLIIEIKH